MEPSTSGISSDHGREVMVTRETRVRLQNPFALRVGQVFTGFGIGCGVGIGIGRPLNVGAIPVLNEVMTAARGATDAFSSVGRHVNSSLKKLGAKNFEAGIGCGVGFGHGFGVGLAIKPGVEHQIQSSLMQGVTHIMMKLGMAPNSSVGQGDVVKEAPYKNQMNSMRQLLPNFAENKSEIKSRDVNTREGPSPETLASQSSAAKYSSRTGQVLSNFLENPLLKDEVGELNVQGELLRRENNLLQMVLKHQQIIEQLMQENEMLHKILVEDLKISPSKIQSRYSPRSMLPCTECFECRRKQKKR